MLKKQRLPIIFDFDDVIGNLITPMIEAINKATGCDFSEDEHTQYDIVEAYDISPEEFFEIMIDFKVLENLKPFHDVKHVFDTVKETHLIHIVTARQWHPNARNITEEWLKKHELHYDHLTFTSHHQSKVEAIVHWDEVALAVDDRDAHCEAYSKHDKVEKVLILDKPWNRNLEGIERISSLSEILKFI